jgi:GNAT superfamily N-acetyltransferase
MPFVSFSESHKEQVLSLRDVTLAGMNLSRFVWEPCQQVESLDQQSIRFVFEDGAVRGYGAAYQLDATHFRLNLIVDPRHSRKRIGSQLLERIEEEVVRMKGKYLQARVLEAMPTSLNFALTRGFIQVHVMRGMSLSAVDFSFGKWKQLGQDLAARGFVLTNLKKELESECDAINKLVQLYKFARQGWPSPDPTWQLDCSVDSLRAPFTTIKYPEHFSILKVRDNYIGFTSAKNLATGTAVHPQYRNLGVATYLKAFNINQCIEAGEVYFESATASRAMQRVNEKLGYRLNSLSEVRFVKKLS